MGRCMYCGQEREHLSSNNVCDSCWEKIYGRPINPPPPEEAEWHKIDVVLPEENLDNNLDFIQDETTTEIERLKKELKFEKFKNELYQEKEEKTRRDYERLSYLYFYVLGFIIYIVLLNVYSPAKTDIFSALLASIVGPALIAGALMIVYACVATYIESHSPGKKAGTVVYFLVAIILALLSTDFH